MLHPGNKLPGSSAPACWLHSLFDSPAPPAGSTHCWSALPHLLAPPIVGQPCPTCWLHPLLNHRQMFAQLIQV